MTATLAALVPVFLLMAFGFALRRARWPTDEFWEPAERLAYYVLFPALLFHSLATAKLGAIDFDQFALVIVLAAVAMTVLVVLLRIPFEFEGPAFTSLLQGAVRFNTYLGLAIASVTLGRDGITYAGVFIAVMVPLGNLMSVVALAVWARPGGALGIVTVVVEVVRNPLIIACALGAIASGTGFALPVWLDRFIDILARAALPVGLLCVGAGIELSAVRGRKLPIVCACALKLAVMPTLAFAFARNLDLGGTALAVIVLFAALPSAPAAYMLARRMGGDAGLMAGILTAQVVLSIVTIPAILAWLV
jgi:predicted permease